MLNLVLVYNAEITVIDLDLYGEHKPEERITGSKTDLGLSAGVDLYASIYDSTRLSTSFKFKDNYLLDCSFICLLTLSNLYLKGLLMVQLSKYCHINLQIVSLISYLYLCLWYIDELLSQMWLEC